MLSLWRRRWVGRSAPDRELAVLQAAYTAQLEIARRMPFAGRHHEDMTHESMWYAARQSVQDSEPIYDACSELRTLELPQRLTEARDEVLPAIARLLALRKEWMRHRPAVEMQNGVPGLRLLERVERGEVPGVERAGPWSGDEDAAAAMQLALPALERMYAELRRITDQDLCGFDTAPHL